MVGKNQARHKTILLGLFIASFLISLFGIRAYTAGGDNAVVLGDNGFSDQLLTVEKGTTVTWRIEGENAHWPASDFHPSHGEYPEGGGCIGSKLDACKELKNGDSYTFTFDKIGVWNMHDHQFHANTMIVEVVEKKDFSFLGMVKSLIEKRRNESLINNFDYNIPPSEVALALGKMCNKDQQCMMPLIETLTKKRGHVVGFETIRELKKIDSNIASNCHRLAHGIGWMVYQTDPGNWRENVRKIDTDCNWGALHGIVEQYVATHKELDEETIKNLCDGEGACSHGIGHMLLVQTNNDIPEALDMCTIPETQMERHMCMTGVFMERMTLQNLTDKENDSGARRMNYWKNRMGEFQALCERFTGEGHNACWEEIARPASGNFSNDPSKALGVCNNSSTHEGAYYCRRRVVSEIITRKKFDMAGTKYICELAPSNDVTFSRDCYLRIAHLAYISLPEEKKGEIAAYCREIPEIFRKGCHDIVGGLSLSESISRNSLN